MSTTRSPAPKAPATDRPAPGLILCAHGVRGGPGVAAAHAAALRRRARFAQVEACCLTGRPTLAEAVGAMAARPIVLVPTLMADGHTAAVKLPRALAQVGTRRRIAVRAPVGTSPRLADLALARVRAICAQRRWTPAATRLIVAGHGTARDARSAATARALGDRLRATRAFASVDVAFLEQEPRLADLLVRRAGTGPCIVVGLFADAGGHGEGDVRGLVDAMGGDVAYTGPIGALSEFADIIFAQAITP